MKPSILFLQAETGKKMLNSKEELQFNISELSGTIVKQGYLVKQVNIVFELSLGSKKKDSWYSSVENECYRSTAVELCPTEWILPTIMKWRVSGYKYINYGTCCSGRINWIFCTCWVYTERHKATIKSPTQIPPELLQSHQVDSLFLWFNPSCGDFPSSHSILGTMTEFQSWAIRF